MKKLIAIIILSISAVCCKDATAQYLDPIMQYQYEMQQYNNMLNQANNLLNNLVQQEKQRQISNAKAICSTFYKTSNDTDIDHLLISLVYANVSDVKVRIINGDIKKTLYSDDFEECKGINGFNLRSSKIKIGSRIKVIRISDDKILANYVVPKKSSYSHTQYGTSVNTAPKLNYDNGNVGGSVVIQKTCSYCGGKGWNPGSKTATYGNMSRYWCYECNEEVGASHSHDLCPSCRGTGKVTSIR